MVWYWINLSHATFGIASLGGQVIIAAPIASWCIGKDIKYVLSYYRLKGAEIVKL